MMAKWRGLASVLALVALSVTPAGAQKTVPDTVAGGIYNQTPLSLSNYQPAPLQLDNAGRLIVNVGAGGGSGGTSSTFNSAFPGTGTAAGFLSPTGTMSSGSIDINGSLKVNCVSGCAGGTFNNNSDGVATSNTNGQAASWLYAFNGTSWDRLRDDANKNLNVNIAASAATVAVSGTVAATQSGTWNIGSIASLPSLAAGTNSIGAVTQGGSWSVGVSSLPTLPSGGNTIGGVTQSGVWTVQPGNTANTTPWLATISQGGNSAAVTVGQALKVDGSAVTQPVSGTVTANLAATTGGGCTPYHLPGGSAATTNATLIASGVRTLCALVVINTTSTIYYLRLYDLGTTPTCSSATGAEHSYPIPASTSGAGFAVPVGPFGESYANGIGYCITSGGSDTDSTAAATGLWVNGSYK